MAPVAVDARLPPGELGDVVADVLAALMESLELGIGEVEGVDLLDALGADHTGQRREDTLFAILAAHERGGGKHGVLVVEHGGANARGGIGDGVLGAALALIGHIAALARKLFDLRLVKTVLIGVFACKLGKRLAGDGRGFPSGDLAKSMLADHVGVDGFGADAAFLGDLGMQTCGIQTAARADDLLGVIIGQMPDGRAYHVAGVCDGHPDAIEAGVDDAVGEGADGVGGAEQLAVAVACCHSHVARGVDDDVARGELLVAIAYVDDFGVEGHEGKGVVQVLGFGQDLLRLDVAKIEFVDQALQKQAVGDVRANVSQTEDTDFTC